MNTIPVGYKQTEIGVIPEDWTIDSFESLTPQGKSTVLLMDLLGLI